MAAPQTNPTKQPRLHRRHRRASQEADRHHHERLDALEAELEPLVPPTPEPTVKERVPVKERDRLPVRRPALQNKQVAKAEAAWWAGFTWNRVAHHFWRLDHHTATLGCSVGRGAVRLKNQTRDYVVMPKRLAKLQVLLDQHRKPEHDDLAAKYQQIRKRRGKEAAGMAATAALTLVILNYMVGPWLWLPLIFCVIDISIPLLIAVVATLAVLGRARGPKGVKLAKTDTRPAQRVEGRPSADLLHQAFDDAGIPGIVVEVAPHREGPGWEADIRIPRGKQTFADAAARQAAIAGNLDATSDTMFLTPIRGPGGSEKRAKVWWSKQNPFDGDTPHPSLNLRSGPEDLWNSGLPIGLDARGTVARIAVVDTPFVLVVGLPGAGKTVLSFGIGAAVGAEPLWDLHAWTFKSSGSFRPLEPLVNACGGVYDYGDDQAAFDRFNVYLDRIQKDLTARNRILDGLDYDDNPNDKVEREVAASDPRLRPLVVLVDEILSPITKDKRILPKLEEIARKARSQHIVFVCLSQYADRKVLEDLQKLFGARVCFRVAQHDDAETALGGFYMPGLTEAHRIPLNAKGVAYVAGTIEDPALGARPAYKIKTFGIDRKTLAEHITRCLELRGQLPPPPADGARLSLVKPDPAAEARARLVACFEPDEDRLSLAGLALRLDVELVEARRLVAEAGGKVQTIRWEGGTPEGVKRASLSVE